MQRTIAMLSSESRSRLRATAAGEPGRGATGADAGRRRPDDHLRSVVQAGLAERPAGQGRLAALTGQMLAAASTTRHPYEQILAKLYPLASSYDVRVDKEMTTFGGRTHRDNVERFFPLLSEACSSRPSRARTSSG